MNWEKYAALEDRIGYTFKNKALLKEALTHASRTNEAPDEPNYERMEFLGDAVIELMITRLLYEEHPDWGEGRMTRTRAMVVSQPSLAQAALDLGLDQLIRMGKGTLKSDGRERPSILCDVFEAVTGAIYLDGGMKHARNMVLPRLRARLQEAQEQGISMMDHKTILQETLQKNGDVTIEYQLVDTQGPPHDRIFVMEVHVDGECLAAGKGGSKKAAQQEAARNALELLARRAE